MISYPSIPALKECKKSFDFIDKTGDDPFLNGGYCAQCSEENNHGK